VKALIMKHIRLGITILVVILFAAPAFAGEFGNVNTRNCTWCHGASAQGYAPAPRLAGQRRQYIENQLWNYIDHRRDNPFSKLYMWHAAANVSPQAIRYLANYFSGLRPKTAGDGNKELIAAGRTIFQDGVPNSNIVACAACHGPQAQGVREIPRLGGLAYFYLQRRLEQWHEGYDKPARHPMPDVASRLSARQIAALASYLSFIKE
jgi:cytochrome c553